MTGGGARGAYQAGVLKRIGEIKALKNGYGPFQIIGGASAGAVNGTALAVGNHSFHRCTKWLSELWANLETNDIFRTDLASLGPRVGTWLRDLSLGGMIGGGKARSLLDASPLRVFLDSHLNCSWIQRNIERRRLKALTLAATNYSSGKTYIFIQGAEGHPTWQKSRRVTLSSPITVDHVCASAAIPIVFAPVLLHTQMGADYFGDGCLRLPAPLSPVIRLGAQKLFAIGVRSQRVRPDQVDTEVDPPPIAQVLGVTLNAIFLDHLDADLEHLKRLNEIISHGRVVSSKLDEPMKPIKALSVTPSVDLGELAERFAKKIPPLVRYLLQGLGSKQASSGDLMSYLLFDTSFTSALIDIGYNDAQSQIDEIENFIFDA